MFIFVKYALSLKEMNLMTDWNMSFTIQKFQSAIACMKNPLLCVRLILFISCCLLTCHSILAADDPTLLQNEINGVANGGTVSVSDNIRLTTSSITLEASKNYTIKANGGKFTLWGNRNDSIFAPMTTGNGSTVTFEGLDFSDGKGADGGVFSFTNPADHLTLSFRGNMSIHNNDANNGGAISGGTQIFSGYDRVRIMDNWAGAGNGGAISGGTQTFRGAGDAIFSGNLASGQGGAYYGDGGTLTLQPLTGGSVVFEGNKDHVNFSNPLNPTGGTFNALHLEQNATVHLNPNAGAQIVFNDPITGTSNNNAIIQNGAGTVMIYGNNAYVGETTINNGYFRLADSNTVYGAAGQDFAVNGGTLGFWLGSTPTSHSTLVCSTFTENAGVSKYYFTNISALAKGNHTFTDVIVGTQENFLALRNSLVTADFAGNGTNSDLVLTNLIDMSDIIGEKYRFADNLRLAPNLDPLTRKLFDDIYHRGLSADDVIGDFGNIYGGGVLESANAYRETALIFARRMNRRTDGMHFMREYDDTTIYRAQSERGPCAPILSEAAGMSHFTRGRSDLWGTFTQDWSRQDENSAASGYEFTPSVLTVGKDRRFGRWTWGLAGQYSHGDVRSNGASYTETTIDAVEIGVYGAWRGVSNYVTGNMQFGVGWNDETTYYASNGNRVNGSYNTAILGTSYEFGRTWKSGGDAYPFLITPHVGIDYVFLNSGAFDEKGMYSARSFGSVNYNVAEIPFGVRFAKTFDTKGRYANHITPIIDLMYMRSVADSVPVGTAYLLSTPDIPWGVTGSRISRDAFRMTSTWNAHLNCGLDFGLGYDLELRRDYVNQQCNATLSMRY